MTALLDRAVTELKSRSAREQDEIARDILARIGEPNAGPKGSVIGRGKGEVSRVHADDDLIDLLTDEDIAEWYKDKTSQS